MAGVEEETRIGNWENGAVVVVRLLEEEQLWRPRYQARISKPYAGGAQRPLRLCSSTRHNNGSIFLALSFQQL
jgi:hypothetical protein